MAVADFEERLNRLDTSLVSVVPTESTEGDRRAWLAVQRAIRSGGYAYLETGSYMGGSIQHHLADPLCRAIVSIDNRATASPDDREQDSLIDYPENTTQNMLAHLAKVDAEALSKIVTFDGDATQLDPALIPEPPRFCFIDGEHTRRAVLSDFEFCLRICHPDAAICFHDARIVHRALKDILDSLTRRNIPFVARRLEGDTFGIFLRDCPAATDPYILAHSDESGPFFSKMVYRHLLKSLVPKWAHAAMRRAFPAP